MSLSIRNTCNLSCLLLSCPFGRVVKSLSSSAIDETTQAVQAISGEQSCFNSLLSQVHLPTTLLSALLCCSVLSCLVASPCLRVPTVFAGLPHWALMMEPYTDLPLGKRH